MVLIAEAIKAASIIQKAYKTYHGKKPTITIRNYIHDDKADKPEYVIPYGRKDFFSHVMSKVQAFVPGAIQTTVLILKGKRIDLYRTVHEYADLFPDAVIQLRMKPPLGGGGFLTELSYVLVLGLFRCLFVDCFLILLLCIGEVKGLRRL